MNHSLGGVSNVGSGNLTSLETKSTTLQASSALSLVTTKKVTQPTTVDTVPQAVSVDPINSARLESLREQVQSGTYVVDAKATAARWLENSSEVANK